VKHAKGKREGSEKSSRELSWYNIEPPDPLGMIRRPRVMCTDDEIG